MLELVHIWRKKAPFTSRNICLHSITIGWNTLNYIPNFNRQKKCMGRLLEYNADVNICNNEGLTAVSMCL